MVQGSNSTSNAQKFRDAATRAENLAKKLRDAAEGAEEVERFQQHMESSDQIIRQATGSTDNERVWDSVIARSDVYEIGEKMSDPDITREEWERLDREQDRALRDEFRALGY